MTTTTLTQPLSLLPPLTEQEEEKFREEYEKNRVKTPKWAKNFSIDGLISELTAEREAKLAETLKDQEEEEEEEEEEYEEEDKVAVDPNLSTASASSFNSPPPPKKERKKKPKRSKNHSHPSLPFYLSDALADNYQDTREVLYEHR